MKRWIVVGLLLATMSAGCPKEDDWEPKSVRVQNHTGRDICVEWLEGKDGKTRLLRLKEGWAFFPVKDQVILHGVAYN